MDGQPPFLPTDNTITVREAPPGQESETTPFNDPYLAWEFGGEYYNGDSRVVVDTDHPNPEGQTAHEIGHAYDIHQLEGSAVHPDEVSEEAFPRQFHTDVTTECGENACPHCDYIPSSATDLTFYFSRFGTFEGSPLRVGGGGG